MRSFLLSGFLLIALCAIRTAHADTLDQSNTVVNGGELGVELNSAYFFDAQTFTDGITGDLTRIQLELLSQPQHGEMGDISPFSIGVQIRGVSNGIPTADVLSSVVLPPGNYLLGTFIDFSQPAFVIAGHQYAISVNYIGAPPLGPDSGQGELQGNLFNAYSGGSTFGSVDGSSWFSLETDGDIFFQTYVEPTPEPGVILLLCAGGALVLLAKFRAVGSHH